MKQTYWAHNGKLQVVADAMSQMIPTQGECTKGSLLELFRLAVNTYQDLYNNGMGNAEVRLPHFIDALGELKALGYVEQASDEVQSAIEQVTGFYEEYVDAEATNGCVTDEDEDLDDAYFGDNYPSSRGLYKPMEVLMDYILFLCSNGTEVFNPLAALNKAA